MKYRLDWKKALVFAAVSAGLIFITESFLMSLGIILLLFVVDYWLAEWERMRKIKKERESGEE